MTRHTFLPLTSAAFTTALLLSACTADLSERPSTVSSEQSPVAVAVQTSQENEVLNKTQRDKSRQHILSQPTLNIAAMVPADSYTQISRDNLALEQPATERYTGAADNPVVQATKESVSTFSIDVDTGSYSYVRRFLQSGNLPPMDAVRVEEMLNYFSYDYADNATLEQPFSVTTELGASPWNSRTQLLHKVSQQPHRTNGQQAPLECCSVNRHQLAIQKQPKQQHLKRHVLLYTASRLIRG